jgi:hypothetical protein
MKVPPSTQTIWSVFVKVLVDFVLILVTHIPVEIAPFEARSENQWAVSGFVRIETEFLAETRFFPRVGKYISLTNLRITEFRPRCPARKVKT